MKKEMEQHERERIQTARPEDLESMTNSPSSLEMNMVRNEAYIKECSWTYSSQC